MAANWRLGFRVGTLKSPLSFIPPMLCSRLENPVRLTERRYIAEPKLDGQRRRRISPSAAPWSAAQSILELGDSVPFV
jgi:hypothetical protein